VRLAVIREELASLEGAIGRLDLTVSPRGASLHVDGREAPAAQGVLRLDPGTHTLDLEAEGFERDRREIVLTPGARVVLVIALRPLPAEGQLIVEPSVPDARVTLDALPVGAGRVERLVAPGDHVIEVNAAGHEVWRRSVRVGPRVTLRVDASLTRAAVPPSRSWVLPVALSAAGALVLAGVVTGVAFATRGDEAPVRGNWGHFMAP